MGPNNQSSDPGVRLLLCANGVYELTVGPATMTLSEQEVSLVAFAIVKMSQRQPALLSRLVTGLLDPDIRPPDDD